MLDSRICDPEPVGNRPHAHGDRGLGHLRRQGADHRRNAAPGVARRHRRRRLRADRRNGLLQRRRLRGSPSPNAVVSYNGTDGLALAADLELLVAGNDPHRRGAPHPRRRSHDPRGVGPADHAHRRLASRPVTLADGAGTLVLGAAGVSGTLSATVVATGIVTATLAGRLAVDAATGTTSVAVAARNLSLDLGGGLALSDAVVGLYVEATGGGTGIALDATGTVDAHRLRPTSAWAARSAPGSTASPGGRRDHRTRRRVGRCHRRLHRGRGRRRSAARASR